MCWAVIGGALSYNESHPSLKRWCRFTSNMGLCLIGWLGLKGLLESNSLSPVFPNIFSLHSQNISDSFSSLSTFCLMHLRLWKRMWPWFETHFEILREAKSYITVRCHYYYSMSIHFPVQMSFFVLHLLLKRLNKIYFLKSKGIANSLGEQKEEPFTDSSFWNASLMCSGGEQVVNLINNGFLHLSASKIECFSHFIGFYFISHKKRNNGSFNYVKDNLNSLLFTFLCINFNAFLIPPHWLVNQALKSLLPCNVFQSFLINLDFKMMYYYLCKLWKCIHCVHWSRSCSPFIT